MIAILTSLICLLSLMQTALQESCFRYLRILCLLHRKYLRGVANCRIEDG